MKIFKMKDCITGDTLDSYSFAFKNGDDPADIDGADFSLTLARYTQSNNQLKYNTISGTGINTMTVVNNIVTMPQVSDEDTLDLLDGKYHGDFIMTKDDESKSLFRVELNLIKNILP